MCSGISILPSVDLLGLSVSPGNPGRRIRLIHRLPSGADIPITTKIRIFMPVNVFFNQMWAPMSGAMSLGAQGGRRPRQDRARLLAGQPGRSQNASPGIRRRSGAYAARPRIIGTAFAAAHALTWRANRLAIRIRCALSSRSSLRRAAAVTINGHARVMTYREAGVQKDVVAVVQDEQPTPGGQVGGELT
jgi:hypothetical protein